MHQAEVIIARIGFILVACPTATVISYHACTRIVTTNGTFDVLDMTAETKSIEMESYGMSLQRVWQNKYRPVQETTEVSPAFVTDAVMPALTESMQILPLSVFVYLTQFIANHDLYLTLPATSHTYRCRLYDDRLHERQCQSRFGMNDFQFALFSEAKWPALYYQVAPLWRDDADNGYKETQRRSTTSGNDAALLGQIALSKSWRV